MSKPDATPGGRGDVGRTDRGAHATPVSRGTSSRWEEVAMMWMVRGFPHPREGGSWSSPPGSIDRERRGDVPTATRNGGAQGSPRGLGRAAPSVVVQNEAVGLRS